LEKTIFKLLIFLVAVTAIFSSLARAAVTEEEARRIFEEKNCKICHTFDDVKNKVASWATKYDNIDQAANAEAIGEYSDFKGLLEYMRDTTPVEPRATDEELQILEEYYKQLFEASRPVQAQPTQEAETVTVTETYTTTTTVTVVETVTETETATRILTVTITPAEEEKGTTRLIASISYIVALLVVLSVVIIVVMYLLRR